MASLLDLHFWPDWPLTLDPLACFGLILFLAIALGELAKRLRLPRISAYIATEKARTAALQSALAEAELKTKYSEEIETLRNKQIEARVKLEALQNASENAWEDMRAGMDMAWGAISEAVNSAVSRFKK